MIDTFSSDGIMKIYTAFGVCVCMCVFHEFLVHCSSIIVLELIFS